MGFNNAEFLLNNSKIININNLERKLTKFSSSNDFI